MNKNRDKGIRYELEIVKKFQELGFDGACSSRSESKRTDDKGVDLCYTDPFQIQCKFWASAPSYHKVLKNMPQLSGTYNLLFHKRSREGSVVVMSESDFLEISQFFRGRRKAPPTDFPPFFQTNLERRLRRRALFSRQEAGSSQRFLWQQPFSQKGCYQKQFCPRIVRLLSILSSVRANNSAFVQSAPFFRRAARRYRRASGH